MNTVKEREGGPATAWLEREERQTSTPNNLQAELRPRIREEAVAGNGRETAPLREEQRSAKYKLLWCWGFLGPSKEGVGGLP